MRCVACGRRLLEPAYTHASGWHLGPKCLEKERAAGHLPQLTHDEKRRTPSYKKPASTRKPVKRIKRVAQVQDDLFCDGVENGRELDYNLVIDGLRRRIP